MKLSGRTAAAMTIATAAVALVVFGVAGTAPIAQQHGPQQAALLKSLPKVTALPSGYAPVRDLGARPILYAAGGKAVARVDDGGAHHGSANTAEWAALLKKGIGSKGTQGVLYRVEHGVVTGAGYLIRQADLVSGKSFRGMTLGSLRVPAHHLTIDLVKGATPDENQYLWLWHFVPQEGPARPMLPAGELPLLSSLPEKFTVTGMDAHPKAFYPRMGRHRRDTSAGGHRAPGASGDHAVLYGEAAGKLIFIEYTFSVKDFAAGVSWSAMPLNGVPIPPIDNLHVMHYSAAGGAPEYYTAHMYFIPEELYLRWETEPPSL
jgi:hypothetical protein